MARPSSNGLLYLLQRPENGRFSYVRKLSPDVAGLVRGDIVASWRLNSVFLSGRTVVKIALETSEFQTARHRWAEVHHQVERLVGSSVALIKGILNEKRALANAELLMPSQQAALSGQVRHDILNAHDLSSAGVPGQGSYADPKHRKKMQDALRDRLAGGFSMTDIDTTAYRLVQTPGQIGMTEVPVSQYKGPTTRVLEENNLAFPAGSPQRRQAANLVMRAQLSALKDIDVRDSGEMLLTPARPERLEPTKPKSPKVSVLFKDYLARAKLDARLVADKQNYLNRFVAIVGDLPVADVKGKHIRQFRDILVQFPRNLPNAMRDAHHDRIIKWANDTPGTARLNARTINTKGIATLSQLLDFAVDEELIEASPCVRVRLKVDENKRKKIKQFTTEELQRFLTSPILQLYPRKIPSAGCGDAAFWLPLLSLFTGARREELGQLRVSDIGAEEYIDFFNIRTVLDDDEIDENGDLIPARKLKTASAMRLVPIHQTLKDIGFLDFVAERRANSGVLLFPHLKAYRGILTKNWGRWWARYQDEHITDDPTKVFHSFRHSFIRRLRNLNASKEHIKALIGHAPADTTDGYGEGYELQTHNETLQKLVYPGLDFSRIRWR